MTENFPSIIKLDQENVVTLLQDPKSLGLGHPLIQQIFLLEVLVAGTSHVKDIRRLGEKLALEEKLNFFREPENPYDNLAIVVKNSLGQKLGYVPRRKNEILARLMDAGKLVFGVLKGKEMFQGWLNLTMWIFLDD
jgi:hypothetical protein